MIWIALLFLGKNDRNELTNRKFRGSYSDSSNDGYELYG